MVRMRCGVAGLAVGLAVVVGVAASGCGASSDTPAAIGDTVSVTGGLIAGTSTASGAVHEFRGVPYAAPPLAGLRWRAPRPLPAWSGVRPADEFSPICPQTPLPEGSFYQLEFVPVTEPQSEDCLYLNVWTAAKRSDERRPVMLWVHGGGFSQGSGSMPAFDGEALARKGVVLVTFNYRLGVLGLLAHPELSREATYGASGNYGLLDHVAALRWVRDNIAAFGGDPNNVTLFGQSSGADNVNVLLASPLSEGLFHRAILQSGSSFAFGRKVDLAGAERSGRAFVDSLVDGSISALRDLPADSVLARAAGFSFRPNVDGWLLPDHVGRVFRLGDQHDVPLMAGSTADEGSTLFGPQLSAEVFRGLVERSYGDDAARFLALYPAGSDDEAKRSFNASFSDEIAWGAQALADLHTRTASGPAYLYLFNHPPPGRQSERYGAFHSSELVYVFGTLDSVDRPWQSEDRALSDLLTSYWTRFAATGDPNDPGLPSWPPYESPGRPVLEFRAGAEPRTRTVLDEERRQFLRTQWEKSAAP